MFCWMTINFLSPLYREKILKFVCKGQTCCKCSKIWPLKKKNFFWNLSVWTQIYRVLYCFYSRVNQVHLRMQTLFPAGDGIFQKDNVHIHATGLVQSAFDEHKDEVKHILCPIQSSNINIPLWSILGIQSEINILHQQFS